MEGEVLRGLEEATLQGDDVEEPGSGVHLDPSQDSPPEKSLLQSLSGAFEGDGLGVHLGGGGTGDPAPMVEHLRNVHHPLGLLGDPQPEVVVLAPFETFTEASDLPDQGETADHEVAEVVVPEEEIRPPPRLKHRVLPLPFRSQLVLVGEEEVEIRPPLQGLGHAEEGVRVETVVVVEEGGVLPSGHFEGFPVGSDHAVVLRKVVHADPGIPRLVLPQEDPHILPGGGILGDAELPPWIPLLQDRIDGLLEEPGVDVVDRHDH